MRVKVAVIKVTICSLLSVTSASFVRDFLNIKLHEDVEKTVDEMVQSYGYPYEEHVVTTPDNYILTLTRIKHGRTLGPNLNSGKRPVVFMAHGLFSTADVFMLNANDKSLGFILPDAGYDVWFANHRGNRYSRKHVYLHPSRDSKFWDFSFQEMAEYDLPTMLDYVLQSTGQQQLYYVGESQGTTVIFALLSERPEFNNKIKLIVALSPVVFCGNMIGGARNAFQMMVPFVNTFGPGEMLNGPVTKAVFRIACNTILNFLCLKILGHTLNATRVGVYTSHFPSGSSSRCMAHFGQLVNSGRFHKYDFGRLENMKRYGQKNPPEYDLSRTTTPTAILWSSNDLIADPMDIDILRRSLRNIAFDYQVPDEHFTHVDFALGMKAAELVYKEVLHMIRAF